MCLGILFYFALAKYVLSGATIVCAEQRHSGERGAAWHRGEERVSSLFILPTSLQYAMLVPQLT